MKLRSIGTVFRSWQDTLPREFVDSLSAMLLYSQRVMCGSNEFIDYQWGTVSWFETMRHEAIEKSTGEWILFLDTDHCFAPDMLDRLVRFARKHECPVLSALYASKHPTVRRLIANVWGPNESILPLESYDPNCEVMEIGPCGAGALLVQRQVFKDLAKSHPGQPAFGTIPGLSEDYSFFKRCKQAGIKTYLAPRIEAGHLMPRAVTEVNSLMSPAR